VPSEKAAAFASAAGTASRASDRPRTRARMFGAAGIGVVLTLLGLEPQHRDLALSSTTREALLAAITVPATAGGDSREPTPAGHAVALRALLPEARDDFTRAELPLLEEWLDRIASRES
jgi:hypothetical protein